MARLSEARLGYLAGLIDGEGGLSIQRSTGNPRARTPQFEARLTFTMGTEEPLKTVCGWFGVEPKRHSYPSHRGKIRWRWDVGETVLGSLLDDVLPHLVLKAAPAVALLRFLAVKQDVLPGRGRDKGGRYGTASPEAIARLEGMYSEYRKVWPGRKGTTARKWREERTRPDGTRV